MNCTWRESPSEVTWLASFEALVVGGAGAAADVEAALTRASFADHVAASLPGVVVVSDSVRAPHHQFVRGFGGGCFPRPNMLIFVAFMCC